LKIIVIHKTTNFYPIPLKKDYAGYPEERLPYLYSR
jgi:hypothetical protein